MSKIHLIYYTDPLCSSCWLSEPFLNRLLLEYGQYIRLEVRMGGLLPSWDLYKPSKSNMPKDKYLSSMWNALGKKYGVCIDGEIWLKSPVQSSVPACVAYYAALNQGEKVALDFLHILREKVFLQHKDISRDHHIISAAIQGKLDLELFVRDFAGWEAQMAFKRDLDEMAKWDIHSFPTLVFTNEETGATVKYDRHMNMETGGEVIYKEWECILRDLFGDDLQKKHSVVCSSCVLKDHRGLTTSEIVSINQQSFEEANKELELDYQKGLLIKEQNPMFDYWSLNNTKYAINKSGFKIKNATIVGGGVAGQFLALLLKRNNIPYQLYERTNLPAPGGLGFLLVENGLEALRLMGLKNQILKKSNTLNFFKAIDTRGNVIYKRILEECVAISRETFFEVVGAELDASMHHHGRTVTGIVRNDEGKVDGLRLDDGTVVQSDIYFGVDGINSVLRSAIHPESRLEEVMEGELVCMVNIKDSGLQQDEFLKIFDKENGKFMGLIPLGNDMFIWFIQFNRANESGLTRDPEVLKAFAVEAVKNYPYSIRKIVEESCYSKAVLWNARRMDILPSFHDDKIVLAGDAAHPFLAFTSQGSNSALEDIVCLMSHLSHLSGELSHEEIFNNYYHARKPSIEYYIKEGDELVEDFFNFGKSDAIKVPISLH